MGLDKPEMIEQLKFEIEMIEKGGYYPSVRDESKRAPEIFRDVHELLFGRICAAGSAPLRRRHLPHDPAERSRRHRRIAEDRGRSVQAPSHRAKLAEKDGREIGERSRGREVSPATRVFDDCG